MDIFEIMKKITDLSKKGMTLELQERIADLREEVIKVKEDNVQLRNDNLDLKQRIEELSQGERCPKCRQQSWVLEGSNPHHIFGDCGVIVRNYKCSKCGFTEIREINAMNNPS